MDFNTSTFSSLNDYFSDHDSPFIKGLLKDKEVLALKISDLERELTHLQNWMYFLESQFKATFPSAMLYLYLKIDRRSTRNSWSLVWRLKAEATGSKSNKLFSYLTDYPNLSSLSTHVREKFEQIEMYRLLLNLTMKHCKLQLKDLTVFYEHV